MSRLQKQFPKSNRIQRLQATQLEAQGYHLCNAALTSAVTLADRDFAAARAIYNKLIEADESDVVRNGRAWA